MNFWCVVQNRLSQGNAVSALEKGARCEEAFVKHGPFIAAAMCDAAGSSNASTQAILIGVESRSAPWSIQPRLMKIEVKKKPATKARKGINPFTGEETVFKAKPARGAVKIKPLKKVKDMLG